MENNIHEKFVKAIHNKNKILLTFYAEQDGATRTRICAPFDHAVSRKYRDGIIRYHFWDYDSPDGSHNLSIKTNQIIDLEILAEQFEPADLVTWTPTNWTIKRDWGEYS